MWTSKPSKPKQSLADTLSRQCHERAAWLKSQGLHVWRESDQEFCTVTVTAIVGAQTITHQETLRIIGRSDVALHARVLWSMDMSAGIVLALMRRIECGGK